MAFWLKIKSGNKLFIVIIIIAVVFRIIGLSQRPMHGDEAINAFKLSELLTAGIFKYNPYEFHGPTLFYFTLPLTSLFGLSTIHQLNETVLRIVPVIFGLSMFGFIFFFRRSLTKKMFLCSSLLFAFSPIFVFYSRYYIHEVIFVFFTYAVIYTGYSLLKESSYFKALLFGVVLGFFIATKETWIILIGAMVFSLAILALNKSVRQQAIRKLCKVKIAHLVLAIFVFFVTIITLFSSFFQYGRGLTDFLSSFTYYFDKGTTQHVHIHPWYMYLEWLINPFSEWVIGEGTILILAIIGFIYILRKKEPLTLLFFIAVFSSISFVFYSVIPYKTPWNILSAWFGFIVLAGYGFAQILDQLVQPKQRLVFYLAAGFFVIHLVVYSFYLNHISYSSPLNPYTYSQPHKNVLEIEARLEKIAKQLDAGYNHYIEVASLENDYWPLPWYLRKFNQVGWFDKIDFTKKTADIAIISQSLEDDFLKKIYEDPPPGERDLYISLFSRPIFLRPGIPINVYIKKDLWDSIQNEGKK